ncbi:MAG: roadblock/LC7 domain-containing protein [Firmicutes bacterium]|nr:roadblock/LC7 domain-containing protein [Bacillota bacterium]
METILEELNQLPEVLGSLIIGKDGLVIVSSWETELDMDAVGAMSADIFGVAESLMEEKLQKGGVKFFGIESENAGFFFKTIDESTFLAVAASPAVNMGLLRIEITAAAAKLREVL